MWDSSLLPQCCWARARRAACITACASVLLFPALVLAQTLPTTSIDFASLAAALQGRDRDPADFMRDASRRPLEVLEFLELRRGMRVLDLYAAGGYYTFILAKAVGPEGEVIAQNTKRGRAFVEDRQVMSQGEALDAKTKLLNNVSQLIAPTTALGLPPESVDFILLAQTLHDYYNPNPQRARALLQTLYTLLKPGGTLGITDHIGDPRFDNSALHRMLPQQALELALEAGFSVTQSDLLKVASDEPSRAIFDPRLARNTSRFLLRLRKPVASN
ncbi:MAG: methyltransferase domain-containing protein [Gammaproteobacteria bacterium]|nr:methyltransferase domain-containing protein [Gammaproteobacteria bacterium]